LGQAGGNYIRHVPPAYAPPTPLPLVVDLHGWGETAAVQQVFSGLAAYGDSHSYITLLPQRDGPVPLWNLALGGPDLDFLAAMLDQAEGALCVDQARVFVAGMSNGAMMSSSVACQFADRVAAVAPVAGLTDTPGCKPARPIPIISFHGTADPILAYTGGFGPGVLSLPTPDGKSTLGAAGVKVGGGTPVPDIAAAWAARDGCSKTPTMQQVASDVALSSFSCPAPTAVELYSVTAGGHAWPGSPTSAAAAAIHGPTTMSISATALIWSFFEAHPLPASA
jgi:polyhydroxybutyrate depolymerase